MAHITGGGFYENIPRMYKDDFTSVIDKNSFEIPEILQYIRSLGVDETHMFNTFNMGIGFVLCVDEKYSESLIVELEKLGEKAYKIGHVEKGKKEVVIG